MVAEETYEQSPGLLLDAGGVLTLLDWQAEVASDSASCRESRFRDVRPPAGIIREQASRWRIKSQSQSDSRLLCASRRQLG